MSELPRPDGGAVIDPITAAWEFVNRAGVIGLLVAAIMALVFGYVVTRGQHKAEVDLWIDRYKEEKEEKDEWKKLAQDSVAGQQRLADALEVTNRIVGGAGGGR